MSLTSRIICASRHFSLQTTSPRNRIGKMHRSTDYVFQNSYTASFLQQQRNVKSSELQGKCRKCGEGVSSDLVCRHCKALQKQNLGNNYFAVFEVSKSYDVDLAKLSKKFKELQKILHPDKFSNASEEEQNVSSDMSAAVNKAYFTLINPLERGMYLLQLCGTEIKEETSSTDGKFLFQVMELSEELESIESETKLLIFERENKEKLKEIQEGLSKAFAENNITSAKDLLIKMKYYHTIESNINKKKEELNVVI